MSGNWMDVTVGLLASLLWVSMFDRLRLIKWPTSGLCGWTRRMLHLPPRTPREKAAEAKPVYVTMFLLWMGWATWLIVDAFSGGIEWGQLMGVTGMLLWVLHTRCEWRREKPPRYVLSARDSFDEAPHAHHHRVGRAGHGAAR